MMSHPPHPLFLYNCSMHLYHRAGSNAVGLVHLPLTIVHPATPMLGDEDAATSKSAPAEISGVPSLGTAGRALLG